MYIKCLTVIFFLIIFLIILNKSNVEAFKPICNVPYRVDGCCFRSKYISCADEDDHYKNTQCLDTSMKECIVPVTVSGKACC